MISSVRQGRDECRVTSTINQGRMTQAPRLRLRITATKPAARAIANTARQPARLGSKALIGPNPVPVRNGLKAPVERLKTQGAITAAPRATAVAHGIGPIGKAARGSSMVAAKADSICATSAIPKAEGSQWGARCPFWVKAHKSRATSKSLPSCRIVRNPSPCHMPITDPIMQAVRAMTIHRPSGRRRPGRSTGSVDGCTGAPLPARTAMSRKDQARTGARSFSGMAATQSVISPRATAASGAIPRAMIRLCGPSTAFPNARASTPSPERWP